jgi:peptide/nickel transport system permease protein
MAERATNYEAQRVPLTFTNLPGIWQLIEGPRGIGLWIVGVVISSIWLLIARFDRVVETFGSDSSFAHVMALLACVLIPAAALYLGRKRPPRPKYGKSQWQLVRERFVRSPQAQVGFFFVASFYFVMFVRMYLAPYGPDEIVDAVNLALKPPLTEGHLLGTDKFGRDVLSRVIHGSSVSLIIGLMAVTLSATLGLVLGLLAGYFGSKIDWFIMRAVDVLLSLPRLVFLLVLMILFKDSETFSGANRIYLIVIFLGLMGWMGTARLVRGEVLQKRQQDFVQAGRALGFSDFRILFRHIAPNCLAPVIVSATLGIGGTILVDASLSFLGLGVPPPTPTWGADVSDGQDYLLTEWWLSVFPGLAIMIAVTSFNLLGDGLRDALDPRLASTGKVPSEAEIQKLMAQPAGFSGAHAPEDDAEFDGRGRER